MRNALRNQSTAASCRFVLVGIAALSCAPAPKSAAKSTAPHVTRLCALATDGHPAAIIVVGKEPTRSAQLAAAELRHYVHEISGAALRIARESELSAQDGAGDLVLVGESERTRSLGLTSAQFQRQEYAIKNVGRWLVLIGRDEEDRGPVDYDKPLPWPEARLDPPFSVQFKALGTLYAVDTFLEKAAGVRWYLPGAIGEVVPHTPTLRATDLDVRQKPWTRFRSIGPPSAWDLFDFYAPGRTPTKTLVQRDMMLWWLRMKMGGDPVAFGHSMYSYFARFGEAHPDWFAEGRPRAGAHLCYGNPGVIAQSAQDARDYFDGKYPTGKFPVGGAVPGAGDYYAVAPMDSGTGWCATDPLVDVTPEPANEIPGAQFFSGRSSAYVWNLVNAVAKEVGKTHPGKRVAGCAYARYFLPPTGLSLEPNVSVVITKQLMAYANPRSKRYFDDAVLAWRKKASELFVWEYYLNQYFAHFTAFPWIAPHQIADDLQFLKSVGIAGEFVETSPWQSQRANMAEDLLPVYLTARLLVDDSRGVDELLDEHYRLFYGPAAAPMKSFFSRLEAAWREHPELLPQTAGRRAWEVFASPEKLRGYRELIDQAQHAAIGEPYRARILLMKEAVLEPMESRALSLDADRRSRPRLACPHVDSAPNIDGKLDDAVWVRAAKTEPFVGATLEHVANPASARVARDEQNLYVAITAERGGGAVSLDESLEIDIDVDRTRLRYAKFVVLPDGSVQSVRISPEAPLGAPWASGARAAQTRAASRWDVELAVPLAALGATSPPSGVWGFDVIRRERPSGPVAKVVQTAWAPSFGARGVAHTFGVLDMRPNAREATLAPVVAVDFEDEIQPRRAALSASGAAGGPVPEATLRVQAGGAAWTDADRVPGKHGHAYSFSKAEQRYIQVTLPDTLGLARDDWTATFWVKFAHAETASLLFSTTTSPAWSVSALLPADGPALQFLLGAGAPSVGAKGHAPALFDGAFHFIAISVARGGEAVLWFDDAIAGSVDISTEIDPLKNVITVGGPYDFFDGAIDSLRIYRGTLEAREFDAVRGR